VLARGAATTRGLSQRRLQLQHGALLVGRLRLELGDFAAQSGQVSQQFALGAA
jgi:hypothetical protein